jgi:hypothetical protein
LNLQPHVEAFFVAVAQGSVEIYNEFSLQHELGIHLRSCVSPSHGIQFERPVEYFGLSRAGMTKREIDISVFLPDYSERMALELKFPRNGQYPEQMFSACLDLAFLEELVRGGFSAGLFVIVVDDPLFYSGASDGPLYDSFRAATPLCGTIQKPTGARDKSVCLSGSHTIRWSRAGGFRYACVQVGQSS